MAKLIGRKPQRFFEFQMDEGGETYRVPLVQSLPHSFVIDESGAFRLTAGAFAAVLKHYIDPAVVDEWTIEEVGDVFAAWDEACGDGPEGVTTGE